MVAESLANARASSICTRQDYIFTFLPLYQTFFCFGRNSAQWVFLPKLNFWKRHWTTYIILYGSMQILLMAIFKGKGVKWCMWYDLKILLACDWNTSHNPFCASVVWAGIKPKFVLVKSQYHRAFNLISNLPLPFLPFSVGMQILYVQHLPSFLFDFWSLKVLGWFYSSNFFCLQGGVYK